MRKKKGKEFINNLIKKADKLCEPRDHIWEDLFDDMQQCKRCGVLKIYEEKDK